MIQSVVDLCSSDAEGNVEFNGGEGSNGDAVADVVEGNDEYDDDVVFLCEIVKSWTQAANISMSDFPKQASVMIWKINF